MKTKFNSSTLFLSFILIFGFFSITTIQAQLPSCDGSGGGLIYLHAWPNIYVWDPGQPVSATNPAVTAIPIPMGGGGLTICNNLNSATPSPTFYTTVGIAPTINIFYYYNGSTWINTGDTLSGAGSLGGGGGYIYSRDDGGTEVYQYDGTGNAVPFITIPGGYGYSGSADVVADCEGNCYVLNLIVPGWLRKYSPAGTLLQEWTVTGIAPGMPSAGFVIVGNVLYYSCGSTMYSGTIGATTVNVTQVPGTFPWIVDMASCPLATGTSVTGSTDTLFSCEPGTIHTVTASGTDPYSATIINGTATVTGSGPSFEVSNVTQPVTLVLKSKGACNIVSDTFRILPAFTVYAGPDETIHGCGTYPDTLHATLTNTTPWVNYSYNWAPASTITTGANTANPIIAATANTLYTLTVTTDATQGNCTLSDEVFITAINESVTADFSFTINPGCNEDTVMFTNTSAKQTVNLWDFGDGASSTDINPIHSYTAKGKRKIMLTASNSYCTDSDIQWADIGKGSTWMRIPNAFSPNGDGLNDKFGPVLNNWPQGYAMRIFNRWGQMVYVSYKETQPWDGIYNGQPADVGTYYYTIDGECAVGGQQFQEKGEFILIR